MKNIKQENIRQLRAASLNSTPHLTKLRHAAVRNTLWLALIVGLTSHALAQTMVSGNISGTWTTNGNPYVVTDNATVPAGQTLTIQPGVTVWIAENKSITANGVIQAVGTPTHRITFQAPIASQYWSNIYCLYSPGTNRFKHCDFRNADTALRMRISGIYGQNVTMNVEILNCTFSNCITGAIYGEAQGFATFSSGPGWDATLNPVVKNCVFGNSRNGCEIKIFGLNVGGSATGYGYANPEIAGNVFSGMTGTAFFMSVGSLAANGSPIFINNTIINCRVGVDSQEPWDAKVQDNIFVGTTNAVKTTGALSRTVSYNCFYGNRTNFTGYPSSYGQIILQNRNGTPCDLLYNIFEDPQFLDPCSLLLATNSPCVDAGVSSISDACFSVSRGSTLSDLGAYGGPDACSWPIPVSCSPPTVIIPPIPPRCLGQTVALSATATGTPPLSYQWYFNSGIIVGSTNATLTLTNLQSSQAGLYAVVVANASGSVTSAPVQLVVNDACVDICMYAGLNIAGLANRTYELRYTTDLSNTNFATWNFLATNTTPWFFVDTNSCGSPNRFYGVKLVP